MSELKITFNKLDEHYLIPILLCFSLPSVIILIYLINESLVSSDKLLNFYQFDEKEQLVYRENVWILIGLFAALLGLEWYALRLKKRWIYVLLIFANCFAFYSLTWVL